jgi:hypothetical protein
LQALFPVRTHIYAGSITQEPTDLLWCLKMTTNDPACPKSRGEMGKTPVKQQKWPLEIPFSSWEIPKSRREIGKSKREIGISRREIGKSEREIGISRRDFGISQHDIPQGKPDLGMSLV